MKPGDKGGGSRRGSFNPDEKESGSGDVSIYKHNTGARTSENHLARHTNHSYIDFKQSG